MRKLVASLSVLLLIISLSPARVHASTQDFVITDFDASYTLSNKDKQGQLHIVEKINVIFTDNNHGILRAIPDTYKDNSLELNVNNVSSTSGAPASYTTYSSGGNTVIKIGDASKTVTGQQQYNVDYTLNNVITFYDDHDELYWDINGDQWDQSFNAVHATLHLGEGLKLTDKKSACFAGSYGSNNSNCTIVDLQSSPKTIKMDTTGTLSARQTATIVVGFQKGYFSEPTATEKAAESFKKYAPITVLPLFFGIYSYRRWRKLGRDPKGTGTIVPEYEAPDNLRPIEVRAIIDFMADNPGITATIVDLAVRGYIKIIETKKDRLIGKDKLEYSLEILPKDRSELLPFEKTVLEGLSGGKQDEASAQGTVVQLSDLKNKFYVTASKVLEDVSTRMVDNGYFVSSVAKAGALQYLLGGMIIPLGFFTISFLHGFSVGAIIAGAICIFFGAIMPARTAKGVAAQDKINGLKLYLETAEKDRIEMMQSPNARYAANHDAPKKTVDLFEKLLPYAMVLGVESQWATQFQDIYRTPPDWYSGNWSSFNTGLFIGSLNSSMTSITGAAFSSPRSSGSSGFGGGGFSGGGGGGGGGGGW